MARTTIDIDDTVLAELRELQRREGRTLGSLTTELLAGALTARRRGNGTPRPAFTWITRPMGTPRVDVDSAAAVQAFLDVHAPEAESLSSARSTPSDQSS